MNYSEKLIELQNQLETLKPKADWSNAIAFNMASTNDIGDFN